MNELLNKLIWSGFKWICFSSDETSDYKSDWRYSYGFYLKSEDILITTDEYLNLSDEYVNLENNEIQPYNDTIFTNDSIFYARSYTLDFEIRTNNFNVFMVLIDSYIKLRTTECYPLISNASKLVKYYFDLTEIDQDYTKINDNTKIFNSEKNLEILTNYCVAKDNLENIFLSVD